LSKIAEPPIRLGCKAPRQLSEKAPRRQRLPGAEAPRRQQPLGVGTALHRGDDIDTWERPNVAFSKPLLADRCNRRRLTGNKPDQFRHTCIDGVRTDANRLGLSIASRIQFNRLHTNDAPACKSSSVPAVVVELLLPKTAAFNSVSLRPATLLANSVPAEIPFANYAIVNHTVIGFSNEK